jgi:UDP-GlcNAc:undecaprenyl-phosphate GlcNAc-1-phosphate transferase
MAFWRPHIHACFGALAFSLLVALVLTPLMRLVAHRSGIVDMPDGRLKTHARPRAYLGGVAVYIALIAALVIVGRHCEWRGREVIGVMLGATLLTFFGVMDDILRLRYAAKFLGQVIVALIVIRFGIRLQLAFLPGWANMALTVLWMVGMTNAMNILDVVDGLAASVAAAAAAAFFAVAVITHQPAIAVFSLAVCGAALGFLPFNWNPATIFLGDAGSMLLGFLLASLAIWESYSQISTVAFVSPLIILGVPIFETFFVMAMRAKRKKSVFKGSRDHYALRMTASGTPPRIVALVSGAACTFLAACAVLVLRAPAPFAIGLCGFVAMTAIALMAHLSRLSAVFAAR